jgi:trehalose/maltose hydrolase-like predicted phosphorylase
MQHHLVPDEVEPDSLAPNLDFYLPRTAHGSSLSPAVSAALLARAGRPDEALAMLGIALHLDLDDATEMTAGGLHLANLAGVWQAVLTGFGGVSVNRGAVHVEPHLPSAWSALHLRFRCLGRRISLSITGDQVRLRTDGPIRVALPGLRVRRVEEEVTT